MQINETKPFFIKLFSIFIGNASKHRPIYGLKNESTTIESAEYAERSSAFEQIITSKYPKVYIYCYLLKTIL